MSARTETISSVVYPPLMIDIHNMSTTITLTERREGRRGGGGKEGRGEGVGEGKKGGEEGWGRERREGRRGGGSTKHEEGCRMLKNSVMSLSTIIPSSQKHN